MNYEEAIEVINEISARLGATATNLYPKLVKYGIVSNGMEFIASLLILLVCGYVFKKCVKKLLNETSFEEDGLYIVGSILAGIGFIFSVTGCYESIHDLVLWATVPEIQAIDFILRYK